LPFTTFKTGELLYSTEGASHFYDVKKLFNLNGIALLISTAIIITLTVLKRKNKLTYHNFLNKTPYFYSGIINIALPLLIGVMAVIDFEAVFDVFHLIMFPGKTDWLFNPKTDQIINILPIEFFACCAALIGVSLIVISVLYIIIHFKTKQKSN
jgi:integral membrane protein (TIGR01906 family)